VRIKSIFTSIFTSGFLILGGINATHAQESTAKYSKVQQRDCYVWNQVPVANETVYWSGACVDGYGEGKGTIVYSVVKNGVSEISMSEGTLKKGKLVGAGIAYFVNGTSAKRFYVNGRYARAANDSEYEKTPDLIKSVDESSLKSILTKAGMTISNSGVAGNNPYVVFTHTNGIKYSAYGTACKDDATECLGMSFYATFTRSSLVDLSEVNAENLKYALVSIYRSADNVNALNVSRYMILDYGQPFENIKSNLTNFINISENVRDKFQ